jgi:hypothetical protein
MPKKKTQPDKPVMGRPTLYDPSLNPKIEEWMAQGYSLESAAIKEGIGPRTVFEWIKKHPDFQQSVEKGRARSSAWWEAKLLEHASGGGNSALIQFGLRNRSKSASGWNHDTQKVEHSGPDGGPIQTEAKKVLDVTKLPPEDLEALEVILTRLDEAEE